MHKSLRGTELITVELLNKKKNSFSHVSRCTRSSSARKILRKYERAIVSHRRLEYSWKRGIARTRAPSLNEGLYSWKVWKAWVDITQF